MASYMYNPSQKITDLLSQYLVFDPAQLEIGIWSGNLSLTNVDLRKEAIYPLLNGLQQPQQQNQTQPQQEHQQKMTIDGMRGSNPFDTFPADNQQHQQDYMKPPLKFKLVSGKIGSLSMKIPWKRLVWGQGDVQVELRNVVITLALETRDETEFRENSCDSKSANEDEELSRGNQLMRTTSSRLFGLDDDEVYDGEKPDPDPFHLFPTSEKKQRILQEAEKYLKEKRSISKWMSSLQRRDRLKKKKEGLLKSVTNAAKSNSNRTENTVDKWLRTATTDFLWRFLAGLQMNILNLKIVIVQDNVEIGLIMPSNKVIAGQQNPKPDTAKAEENNNHVTNLNTAGDRLTHVSRHETDTVGSSVTYPTTPPQSITYESGYDDGEHVDKIVQIVGVGLYVRDLSSKKMGLNLPTPRSENAAENMNERERNDTDYYRLMDISTADYIIRPFTIDFSFSLFFPYPPEKRASMARTSVSSSWTKSTNTFATLKRNRNATKFSAEISTMDDNSNMDYTTDSSSKRRRGKRDKLPLNEEDIIRKDTEMVSHSNGSPRRSPSLIAPKTGMSPQFSRNVNEPQQIDTRSAESAALVRQSWSMETYKPLAQPDDFKSLYATAISQAVRSSVDLCPRFDAKLTFTSVHATLSTKQYELISAFLASGAKLRNGRPNISIKSFLHKKREEVQFDQTPSLPMNSLHDTGHDASLSDATVLSIRHDDFMLLTKCQVIRSWWLYVLGAVLWELRQRKKIRRIFQHKYLSFSWKKQQYRRREYIKLFILTRLTKNNENSNKITNRSIHGVINSDKSYQQRLMDIEDELGIEQILLYRSIARLTHVRGLKEIPDSLLILHDQSCASIAFDLNTSGFKDDFDTENAEFRSDQVKRDAQTADTRSFDDNPDTIISVTEEHCQVARQRRSASDNDKLPTYSPFPRGLRHLGIGSDEISYGVSANQTVRTSMTTRSNHSIAISILDSLSSKESLHAASAMVISFSMIIEELELILTEPEFGFLDECIDFHRESELKISSQQDDENASSVSELTNEGIAENDEEITNTTMGNRISETEPIIASTDYLLFQDPENIILQINIKSLACTTLGRSGGSRNMNFSVGKLDLIGEAGISLLSVGAFRQDEAPINEVHVTNNPNMNLNGKSRSPQLWQALTVSIVDKNDDNFLQCDISQLKGCLHHESLQKLIVFATRPSVHFPKKLLFKTPREDIRLYVLQQNSIPVFAGLNCSIRIQGFAISLPVVDTSLLERKADRRTESASASPQEPLVIEGALLHCGMIEIYSGSMVESLKSSREDWLQTGVQVETPDPSRFRRRKSSNKVTDIRQLRMLDVNELLDSSNSLLSHHWVISIIDVNVQLFDDKSTNQLSLFENTLDLEVLLTLHLDPGTAYQRAKNEIIAEISPIHLLISKERLRRFSLIVPAYNLQQIHLDAPNGGSLPPRLEILSNFVRYSLDFSTKMSRVSFLTYSPDNSSSKIADRRLQVKLIIVDFLQVVSSFDLVYPHEESLAAAMQICIDRLSGMGLPLEVGWEATNAVMLIFLEVMAESKDNNSNFLSESTPIFVEDSERLTILELIEDAADRTIDSYAEILVGTETNPRLSETDVVVDFPDGFSISVVDLFFDQHICGTVPTLFVVSGGGIHILRINPPEILQEVAENESFEIKGSIDNNAQSKSTSQAFGITFHHFTVDKHHGLGRGGLPLTVLGTDTCLCAASEKRERERLVDVELGDLAVFFAHNILLDMVESLELILSPMKTLKTQESFNMVHKSSLEKAKDFFLLTCTSASATFFADNLFPFTRVVMTESIARHVSSSLQNFRLSSGSLEVQNLSAKGEIYPTFLEALPRTKGVPFRVNLKPGDKGSLLSVDLNGVRIIFLQQYLSEVLQYFTSGSYGFGRFVEKLNRRGSDQKNESHISVLLRIFDSSVILPRSSESCDLVSIEVDMVSVEITSAISTFTIPSATHMSSGSLELGDKVPKGNIETCIEDLISRTHIQLDGLRIYTSLPDRASVQHQGDNKSFRFLYEVNGRAEAGKHVYREVSNPDDQLPEDEIAHNAELASRLWEEVTSQETSLDIFVDYAPYLRVLVLDSNHGSHTGIDLDVKLSQFSLLLSVWYINMQELPKMFPYSEMEIESTVENSYANDDFPDHGTKAFKQSLLRETSHSSEFVLKCKQARFRCTFDEYLHHESTSLEGISISIEDIVVHVASYENGTMRVGVGGSYASIVDEAKTFSDILLVGERNSNLHTWADYLFGIDFDSQNLGKTLPMPFQLSLSMLPRCTMVNLGMDKPFILLSDFGSVIKLVEFMTSYSNDPQHGHPGFEVMELVADIRSKLVGMSGKNIENFPPLTSTSDFRLWMTNPTISIPCYPEQLKSPGLRINSTSGIWYKYSTIDFCSSQEIVADQMSILIDTNILKREKPQMPNLTGNSLISGLSFGLRFDSNYKSNHQDICIQLPFDTTSMCSIISPRICVSPMILSPPTVCVPFHQPERFLGPNVCDVTCIIDHIPLAFTAVKALLGIDNMKNDAGSTVFDQEDALVWNGKESYSHFNSGSLASSRSTTSNSPADKGTFSFVASVNDVRVFALDPVLGPHLPIALLSISSISCTASQFASLSQSIDLRHGEAPPEDLQVHVVGNLWADYFKLGQTRSWEPLLEPYHFTVQFEQSRFRGFGLSLESDSPFHVNISSALLNISDEIVEAIRRLTSDVRAKPSETTDQASTEGCESGDQRSTARDPISEKAEIMDQIDTTNISHEIPAALKNDDRVSFSFCNKTGQKVRLLHSKGSSSNSEATLTYLEHRQTTKLSFHASITVVKNLKFVEVPFPGLTSPAGNDNIPTHSVDIQIPGFLWLKDIMVDTFGRTFSNIIPRSALVASKVNSDWRLANVMKLLVEVGMKNGGRQVTIRSLFSLVNKTTHNVCLVLHPEQSFQPPTTKNIVCESVVRDTSGCTNESLDSYILNPDDTFQVPTLLLESALNQPGIQLGCMWMKPFVEPADSESLKAFLGDNVEKKDKLKVNFSSKPLSLIKLVLDSSRAYEQSVGQDISTEKASTALQMSCPVFKETGDRVAPFCYALEVGRSPIVRGQIESQKKKKKHHLMHGPIAYSIFIHPPLIIVNLLPKRGRFELMHAIRRTVLWYGDLDPGQEVPVHSVGLDAPVLLLINLGFARTPVGEGALIHHGSDPPSGIRDNLSGLKTIGKAGIAVTKQIGKTLSALGESPDQRGHQKLKKVQYEVHGQNNQEMTNLRTDEILGFDAGINTTDGKTYKIESTTFLAQDVAAETVVVDGIGQRLTLNINNVRGGGGQRRISLFSLYWIVNCTEHPLRYRQENSNSYVSGTIHSPERDGSLPFGGERSRSNYDLFFQDENMERVGDASERGIFSGAFGALATSPGRCDLPPDRVATIIDKNLSLEQLSRLAFMFNFQDGPVMTIGSQKLSVQLGDGTGATRYESEWSKGFGIDSVGISQIISMHCKDGRLLELSVVVSVAPDYLAGYTKIVRVLPRYILVNTLPFPVRIWQDSSVFRPISSEHNGAHVSKAVKWRLRKDDERVYSHSNIVNQYEALWGRIVNLEDQDTDRIRSGTTAHASALYITTVRPSEVMPFNLPDSRGERQLRIDAGAPFRLTASISADIPGDHTLKIEREFDMTQLSHISTRASPQFEVKLNKVQCVSCNGELGIWFETEWGSRSLIVKGIKKNSFAFCETDVRVGDELLSINGFPVSRMTFSDAMTMLRARLNELSSPSDSIQNMNTSLRNMRRASLNFVSKNRIQHKEVDSNVETSTLRLVFRTLEERLRKLRVKATQRSTSHNRSNGQDLESMAFAISDGGNETMASLTDTFISAELRTIHHSELSMFLVLRDKPIVPFLIQNRSIHSSLYYRQRGCHHHAWKSVKPGQSVQYSWDEPMKARRLSVRVAGESELIFAGIERENEAIPINSDMKRSKKRSRQVEEEEDAIFSQSLSVRLEEIGYRDYLEIPRPKGSEGMRQEARFLIIEVEVNGPIRVLAVNDLTEDEDDERMIRQINALENHLDVEENHLQKLQVLRLSLTQSNSSLNDAEVSKAKGVFEESKTLMEEFSSETIISGCDQIVVQVLEAVGLTPDSFVGTCNPYAEIKLKTSEFGHKDLFRKESVRRTYHVRKTVRPTWKDQSFVFNVPKKASSISRGYSIQVRIRNFRTFRVHQQLGKAQIDLYSLRNQEPLVGWFPLAGGTGSYELESQQTNFGRGSVKLRLQWIYSVPKLVQYYILLSEVRLSRLLESLRALSLQLETKNQTDENLNDDEDGFKTVRVHNLIADKNQTPALEQQGALISPSSTESVWKAAPSFVEGHKGKISTDLLFSDKSSPPGILYNRKRQDQSSLSCKRLENGHGQITPLRILPQKAQQVPQSPICKALSVKLTEQRTHSTQSTLSKQLRPPGSLSKHHGFSISVSSLRSWMQIQALYNEVDFSVAMTDNVLVVSLSDRFKATRAKDDIDEVGACELIIKEKLCLPAHAPITSKEDMKNTISSFIRSRNSFDRAARRSIKTILNPGGWLTVRPITALNLPESFASMFVKVCFGSEIILSEMADAKVIPTWYKSVQRGVDDKSLDNTIIYAEELLGDESENNLHIYVAPQQTNGSIRVSVIGERSHQKLLTRSELGVLHLPLGLAIAACIECTDDAQLSQSPDIESRSLAYVRWFPLMSPRDAVPVDGDWGLSWRPKETEKLTDNQFRDYFAPCLQLALIWTPDAAEVAMEEEADENYSVLPSLHSPLTSQTTHGSVKVSPALVQHYFNADVGRFSFSLIDSQRSLELVSFTAIDIDARYWVTTAKTRMGVSVGWIQLDYQDENVREPVILAPTPSDFLLPVLQVLAVKDNIRSRTEVLTFDFIDVSIAEFDITIEESLVFDLYSFFNATHIRRSASTQKIANSEIEIKPGDNLTASLHSEAGSETKAVSLLSMLFDEINDDLGREKKVYIDQLFLGVVKVNLSYLKGKRISWDLTKQGRWTDGRYVDKVLNIAGGEYLMKQLSLSREVSDVFLAWSRHTFEDERVARENDTGSNNIAALLATIIPTLSDAPIRLQGKALNHVFERPTEIIQSIREFYLKETLNQIYKIIGSLDFVGNPTMLVTSFMSGVRDLVGAPSSAFLHSPTDATKLGLGVAQGTISLFSHSISGFFGVLAKVAAASGQAMAILSLDSDFRDWHRDKVVAEATNLNRDWKRRGVQNSTLMLTRPVLDIILGIAGGISGVIASPIKGYQTSGGVGIMTGMIVGSVGLVAKPTVGVLDAFTHFSSSLHDIAKSVNVLDRRHQPAHQLRLPYTFGMLSILEPYNIITARAAYFLKLFPFTYALTSSETIIHVEVLPNFGKDTYVIATSVRVILIKVKKELTGALNAALAWEVYLGKGNEVASRISDHGHNGVALTITVGKVSEKDVSNRSDKISMTPNSIRSLENSSLRASRSINLTLHDDKVEVLEGEEYGHGTGRSVRGDVLDWFTILAEYENRGQLTRMHNAICCIIGDFDSIVRDPWIGRADELEGYTNFGIFFFEPESEEGAHKAFRDIEFHSAIEDIPWVSFKTFREIRALNADEQISYLKKQREDWSFEKELEASYLEGGPDWLIKARATAIASEREVLQYCSSHEKLRDDEKDDKPQSAKSGRVRSILKKLTRSDRANGLNMSFTDNVSLDDIEEGEMSKGFGSVSFENSFNITGENYRDGYTGSIESGDESAGSSSKSVVKRDESSLSRSLKWRKRRSGSILQSQGSMDSTISYHTAYDHLVNEGVSPKASPYNLFDEIPTETEFNLLKENTQVTDSDISVNQRVDGLEDNDKNNGSLHQVQVHESHKRMDRMEALLERLLIFSSEQALQHHQNISDHHTNTSGGGTVDDIHELREQINSLRQEIKQINKPNDESIVATVSVEEINHLRNEIASMKELLQRKGS